MKNKVYLNNVYFMASFSKNHTVYVQTRFQKSWDTVQIVNKKGMQ